MSTRLSRWAKSQRAHSYVMPPDYGLAETLAAEKDQAALRYALYQLDAAAFRDLFESFATTRRGQEAQHNLIRFAEADLRDRLDQMRDLT